MTQTLDKDFDLLVDATGEMKVSIRNEKALPKDDIIMADSETPSPRGLLDSLCQRVSWITPGSCHFDPLRLQAFKEANRLLYRKDILLVYEQ